MLKGSADQQHTSMSNESLIHGAKSVEFTGETDYPVAMLTDFSMG